MEAQRRKSPGPSPDLIVSRSMERNGAAKRWPVEWTGNGRAWLIVKRTARGSVGASHQTGWGKPYYGRDLGPRRQLFPGVVPPGPGLEQGYMPPTGPTRGVEVVFVIVSRRVQFNRGRLPWAVTRTRRRGEPGGLGTKPTTKAGEVAASDQNDGRDHGYFTGPFGPCCRLAVSASSHYKMTTAGCLRHGMSHSERQTPRMRCEQGQWLPGFSATRDSVP
jgi:hypothetical protein